EEQIVKSSKARVSSGGHDAIGIPTGQARIPRVDQQRAARRRDDERGLSPFDVHEIDVQYPSGRSPRRRNEQEEGDRREKKPHIGTIILINESKIPENESKRILETNERRDSVADAVVVEREQNVRIEEQPLECVDLEPHGAAHHVERVGREGDIRERRLAVERVKRLRAEALGV